MVCSGSSPEPAEEAGQITVRDYRKYDVIVMKMLLT